MTNEAFLSLKPGDKVQLPFASVTVVVTEAPFWWGPQNCLMARGTDLKHRRDIRVQRGELPMTKEQETRLCCLLGAYAGKVRDDEREDLAGWSDPFVTQEHETAKTQIIDFVNSITGGQT